MAKTAGFDLSSVFGEVSKMDTGNSGVLQMIPRGEICTNAKNFYDVSDINGLIDAILLDGLQSPLVVSKSGDGYVIISGHRRFAALGRILDEHMPITAGKLFAAEIMSGRIPCLVNEYASELEAELALIRANSDTRIISSAEKAQQIERVERLLYELKEQGREFPGRMRDYVAEACKVSASKIARLKVISGGLVDVARELWEGGSLKEQPAYVLAQLPPDHQTRIVEAAMDKSNKNFSLYDSRIEKSGKLLEAMEQEKCPKTQAEGCEHADGRWDKFVSGGGWSNACDKCCDKCYELARCKQACPKLAGKVKQLRDEEKQRKQALKTEQENQDAPKIARVRVIWERFAAARSISGLSAEDYAATLGIFFSPARAENWHDSECGALTFTPNSNLPFPMGCGLSVDGLTLLCKAADTLGCTVDYLIGRGEADVTPCEDEGDET